MHIMSWLDIFLVLFIILVTYIGSKRGLIFEIFDMLVLTIGLGLTLHIYKHLADFLNSVFKLNKTSSAWVSFIILFLIIAGLLMFLAVVLDKFVKLAVVMKPLHTFGGGVLAFIKSFILIWLILLLILVMPVKEESKRKVFSSAVARSVWNATPIVVEVFDIVSPSFAQESLNKIIKKSSKITK
ncbi:MAG: CvpA family protein [Armatimonadota bacterium]